MIGQLKAVALLIVVLGLIGVWAAAGAWRIAGSALGMLLLPIAGAAALGQVKSPAARGLIAAGVVVGFALIVWQFALAWM